MIPPPIKWLSESIKSMLLRVTGNSESASRKSIKKRTKLPSKFKKYSEAF